MIIEFNKAIENEETRNAIWDILCDCNDEFIPKLSDRNGPAQKDLKTTIKGKAIPKTYFDEMIKQNFIMIDMDGKMVGFIKDFGKSLHVTTVCVRKEYRNRGITNQLYQYLENTVTKLYNCPKISTRTWSLNGSHIHVLDKRGYERLKVLQDDRGNGVDTIYFGKAVPRPKEKQEEK